MRQSVGAYAALHFELFGSQTKGREAVLPRWYNEGQTQVSWNFEETSQLFMNKTGEKDSYTETGIIKKTKHKLNTGCLAHSLTYTSLPYSPLLSL